MIFGELYRHNGEWKFRAVGQGFDTVAHGVGRVLAHVVADGREARRVEQHLRFGGIVAGLSHIDLAEIIRIGFVGARKLEGEESGGQAGGGARLWTRTAFRQRG